MANASTVLDASAFLALVQREAGSAEVARHLPGALMSSVNVAEVVGKLREGGVPAEAVRAIVDGVGLVVVPFDEEQAHVAGALRVATRAAGLSLGDRACLALASVTGSVALTTDAAWRRAATGVPVVVVARDRR